MAVFHAFRALRPTPEKAADVAALPYDVVNREEAKSIGDENPLSFLHIDRPEMDLEPETDLYDDRVYEKAKENLDNMEEKGILVQDQKACYYIYELVRKGKHILIVDDVLTTGATTVACASRLAEIEGVRISVLTLAMAE